MHPIEKLSALRDYHKALTAAYEDGIAAVDVAIIEAAKVVTAHMVQPNTCSNKAATLSRSNLTLNRKLAHIRADILDNTSSGPRGTCDAFAQDRDDDIPF